MSALLNSWRSLGLRPRLVALVLAAVTPFLLLIGMVARQHRFNERSVAELQALEQAHALGDRVDSRIGAIETLLLALIHAVSTNPADSLRNDKLLRDVVDELPSEFAHFAVVTLKGVSIGTSDTLNGKRRAIPAPASMPTDTSLDFEIQGPQPMYGSEGVPAIVISHADSALGIRMIGLITVARLQRELSRAGVPPTSIATIIDPRGTVIFRSRSPEKWLGKNVATSEVYQASHNQKEGVAEIQDLDAGDVFSGHITTRHVPWTVQVASPQLLAFAKERADFWRAIGFGALALLLAIVLAWTQATRIIVPLQRLVRDAVLFSKGELSHRSTLERNSDEIGVLGKTLNSMAEMLEKREDALRRGESRFRSIIEKVDDVILIVEPTGKRRYVSPAMSRIMGYSQEELLALQVQDMVHPTDWPGIREIIRQVRSAPGVTVTGQARYRHADGSWRTFDVAVNNLTDDPGVEGLLVSMRDVTQQVTLEGDLRQAQKMESVGQLAGGVAHDFNNLLTVITGRIGFLTGAPNLDADQSADLAEIGAAATRAAELTRQLLAFSRKQLLQPRVLDLNRTLDDMQPLLRRLIGEDIKIHIEHAEELGSVAADPGQLQQILMNLALNARDAMPQGGALTFKTCNETVRPGSVMGVAPVNAGEYVCLEVSDTGLGMDSETQVRIFEPFFTTKGQGKGTGLGLSTVYGIVKQSGGGISVTSEPGAGSTFRVYFPRVEGYALAQPPERDVAARLSGTETILVVEDEASVRNLVERVLRSRGYHVLAAEHGTHALQLAADPGRGVDLVLTDIVMPAMSGRELVEALQISRPLLRVLYMSGYTDDEIMRRGLHDVSTSFIQKPFTAETLAVQVRRVLDAA